MSEADPAAVRQYLLGRRMEPEIIDWKYFDACFNRNRERGIVWVRQNQVAGFLGLIPFRLAKNDVRADCAWSCDWSVDAQGAGTGLLLVKRARELYDGVFNLGGNQNTRQIFPRLADRTVSDAGVSMVLPLRLGSVFAILPAGMIKRLLSRQEFLQQIPLRWVRASNRSLVTIEPGVSAHIMRLFDDPPGGDWRPLYNSDFIDWQFRRCPALICWSCRISLESRPRTAALIWRSQSSKRFWRFALCGETTDLEKITTLIRAVASFVYGQGCVALFAIASHRERDLIKALAWSGFLRHARLPFYVMRGRSAELPTDEFAVLNFLDSDLAYRFEQDSVSTGG